MVRERRVVTTTMLCMKYQRDIENFRFQFGKLTVFAEHIQDVLGKAVLFLRVFDQQIFILTEMPVRMIRIYSDQRHFCDQLHGLAQGIFHADVIRIIIVSVQCQHASLHGIHDIFIGCFHDNITDKTVVQIHHIRQQIVKHRRLSCVRDTSEQQGIDDFLEPLFSFFQACYHICYVISLKI